MQIKQFQREVALSLDACRSKCVSRHNRCSKMLQVGSPNHGSVHTEMWQSMVPSNLCVPNGSSLLAPSSTHIALARRPSIQMRLLVLRDALARRLLKKMRFLCVQLHSRSTPANQNAFPICSAALSFGARRRGGQEASRHKNDQVFKRFGQPSGMPRIAKSRSGGQEAS